MQCITFAVQLGQHHPKLQGHNTTVLVIGGGSISRAQVLAKTSRLPYLVLADADRSVYELYRLGKRMLMIQQSGLVIVDKQGVIEHYQRYTNPGAWMGNSEIDNLQKTIERIEARPR